MLVRVLPSVHAVGRDEWGRLSSGRTLFDTGDWLAATGPTVPGEPLITAESGADGLQSLVVWRAVDSAHPSPYFNVGSLLARLTGRPRLPAGGWTLNCAEVEMHSPLLAAPGVEFDAHRLRAHLAAAVASRDQPPVMCGINFLPHDPAPGLRQSLVELGFQECCGYRTAVLDVPGDSFEDYLAQLARHRRHNVRRDRRVFAQSGQWTSVASGPTATGPDLVRLHRANRRKHGGPADEHELRALHTALAGCCGDDLVVIRAHRGTRCVGFAMFVRDDADLHVLCVGFEEHQDKVGPYFECMYYQAVEWAQRNGVTSIHYGIGATAAKSARGCRIIDVSSWYLPPGAPAAVCAGAADRGASR